ncbi:MULTISPECIES: response regulator [Cohnella]|uniref:response regulator n=1 Tax=Cohnella TaxID=329857 RepID=UPI0009BA5C36|nr:MULTISPECIES: response regulator [Cohnella]MBN2983271.1 response regulator [Cohnella algarum]
MLKVAVVDDEERIRLGLAKLIEKTDEFCRVVGCYASGQDLLDRLHGEEADLVITDIKMPQMDGLQLIGELRRRRPEIKLAVVSGFSDFSFAKRAIRLNVQDYLLKPVDREELEQLLIRVRAEVEGRRERGDPADSELLRRESDNSAVEAVKAFIREHYREELELSKLAETVYLTPSYLSKLFRHVTGETITDYWIGVRIGRAKDLLRERRELKTYEVGERVGYADPAYFNKVFKRTAGMTPKEYRERAGLARSAETMPNKRQ